MNSDTSVWETLSSRSARPLIGLVLAAWVTAITPLQAMAQEGVLVFHGQLVNSTCAINQPGRGAGAEPFLKVQVQPGVFMDVTTQHNACTGETVPFTSQYRALPATVQGIQAGGVVTITYQ
ncbi:hypothetical protein PS3A_00930 [Pseudomonas sp. 3A(2025)]